MHPMQSGNDTSTPVDDIPQRVDWCPAQTVCVMIVVEVSGCCVSRVLVVAVKVLSNYWRRLCAIQVADIKLMSDNFEKAHESDTERVWLARLHLTYDENLIFSS